MRVHDLNWRPHLGLGRVLFFLSERSWWSCVGRSIRVCTTDGLLAAARDQRLRRALRGRPSLAWFLVPRSILVAVVCAAHISRKLARHRHLSARSAAEAVSRRLSRQGFAEDDGRCESASTFVQL